MDTQAILTQRGSTMRDFSASRFESQRLVFFFFPHPSWAVARPKPGPGGPSDPSSPAGAQRTRTGRSELGNHTQLVWWNQMELMWAPGHPLFFDIGLIQPTFEARWCSGWMGLMRTGPEQDLVQDPGQTHWVGQRYWHEDCRFLTKRTFVLAFVSGCQDPSTSRPEVSQPESNVLFSLFYCPLIFGEVVLRIAGHFLFFQDSFFHLCSQ